jgi:hypothetical protein
MYFDTKIIRVSTPNGVRPFLPINIKYINIKYKGSRPIEGI